MELSRFRETMRHVINGLNEALDDWRIHLLVVLIVVVFVLLVESAEPGAFVEMLHMLFDHSDCQPPPGRSGVCL
jgi:hypothetical protein